MVREEAGAEQISIEPHLGLSDKERLSVGSGATDESHACKETLKMD